MKKTLALPLLFITVHLLGQTPQAPISQHDIHIVRTFIRGSWEKTVRFTREDQGDLIVLPHEYTVPSISKSFQSMFYWDTYFTGEGLIINDYIHLAKANVENMLYIVEKYGKMLNGNRTYFENRSQPPYLSMMIESIYRQTQDKEWLKRVLPTLKKEYDFWMTQRITPIELSHYSNEGTDSQKTRMVKVLNKRLGEKFKEQTDLLTQEERLRLGSHFITECESGWDFSPRFQMHCEDFCSVDLNANLYYYEKNFEFSQIQP